jgi:hypothetical protein
MSKIPLRSHSWLRIQNTFAITQAAFLKSALLSFRSSGLAARKNPSIDTRNGG